jgi:hypothetical protein
MKLTKVAETIIAEDSSDSFQKHITEFERDKDALQHVGDLNTEDYDLVVVDNKRLASECDQLNLRCKNLHAAMARIRSDAGKCISDHEVKVKFTETHSVEIAAEGNKILKDFENELVQKLGGLCEMYADKVQTIGGLYSPMSVEEPLVKDYLDCFSENVAGLTDMFCGVNVNFATAAIEGALVLVGDFVDLEAV